MFIIRYNEIGIGKDCTIHKLIIIGILCDKIPMIMSINSLGIRSLSYNLQYHSCY